jgi:hypothetical protein
MVGLEGNQAILSANNAVRKIVGTDCLEMLGATHLISNSQEVHLSASDLGKALGGLSAQKVNKLLQEKGFIEPFRDTKNRIHWKPTETGKPYSILKDTGKKHGAGTPVQQLFWLESVVLALNIAALGETIN